MDFSLLLGPFTTALVRVTCAIGHCVFGEEEEEPLNREAPRIHHFDHHPIHGVGPPSNQSRNSRFPIRTQASRKIDFRNPPTANVSFTDFMGRVGTGVWKKVVDFSDGPKYGATVSPNDNFPQSSSALFSPRFFNELDGSPLAAPPADLVTYESLQLEELMTSEHYEMVLQVDCPDDLQVRHTEISVRLGDQQIMRIEALDGLPSLVRLPFANDANLSVKIVLEVQDNCSYKRRGSVTKNSAIGALRCAFENLIHEGRTLLSSGTHQLWTFVQLPRGEAFDERITLMDVERHKKQTSSCGPSFFGRNDHKLHILHISGVRVLPGLYSSPSPGSRFLPPSQDDRKGVLALVRSDKEMKDLNTFLISEAFRFIRWPGYSDSHFSINTLSIRACRVDGTPSMEITDRRGRNIEVNLLSNGTLVAYCAGQLIPFIDLICGQRDRGLILDRDWTEEFLPPEWVAAAFGKTPHSRVMDTPRSDWEDSLDERFYPRH